jgi:uncharacterized protein YggU (UPF0235/DUF167 family)
MTGAVLDVKVIPRARRTAFGPARGPDAPLVVRVAAAPAGGAANDALLDFLARELRIPRSAIRIAGGVASRRKRLVIAGVTREEIRARISRCWPTS